MNRERWCTKEDVLKDLAVATGKRLHIDNSYLVVGERPPPKLVCESDDEMELMFRDVAGAKPLDVETTPDLRGITQMLRMVQSYDDTSDDNTKICSTRPKSPCDIITISKLNPNVMEFRPKGTGYNDANEPSTNAGKKNKAIEIVDPNLVKTHEKRGDNTQKVLADKKIDLKVNGISKNELKINNAEKHQTKDVASDLRAKIQQPASNEVTKFQMKKERNVAIANLQKLLSSPPEGDRVQQTAKPIKLLTPDYYKHSKAAQSETESEILHNNKISDDVISNESNLKSSKPSLSSYEVIKKLLHSKLNVGDRTSSDPGLANNLKFPKLETKAVSTTLQNNTDDCGSCEKVFSDTDLSDPQIRDSIKKVNNWMNKNDGKMEEKPPTPQISPPTPQISSPSPPVFLSAITFKRKEVKKSPTVSETTISKPSQNTIEKYKPSEYAQELSKMYMERVKKIKKTKEKNGWANLEELLKEKDEKIRQKQKSRDGEVSSGSQ